LIFWFIFGGLAVGAFAEKETGPCILFFSLTGCQDLFRMKKHGKPIKNIKHCMTKRIQSKHKIERRYGVALWGQASSPVHVRSYPPGQHGSKGPRKLTDYGQQLAAKQKLKGYYGNIVEKQFRNIYKEAVRLRGDTSEKLVGLLESRLDAVVYRLKWSPTVFNARQLVGHKHVLVNGRCVNIPSFRLRQGDVVTLREHMRQNGIVVQSIAAIDRDIPEYLEYKASDWTGKLSYVPELSKVPYPIQMNVGSIVEFYSR
jgi:small subunit ribosomal protein S4